MAYMARPVWDRLMDKFTVGDGCWEWNGSKTGHGYGKVLHQKRIRVAHRVLYELLVGPVPDGLELDHLCRNPGCVRFDHLEPVSHAENIQRAHDRDHCKRGHERTPENTYQYAYGRRCKPCQQANQARRRIA